MIRVYISIVVMSHGYYAFLYMFIIVWDAVIFMFSFLMVKK
jgi:hypothetical protein